MNHIGAAVLLAQTIVGRAGIEDEYARGARAVGDGENFRSGEVDDEKPYAVLEHAIQRPKRILAGRELRVDNGEGLVEKAPGGVIVVHRHARAGDKVVRGRDIKDRDRVARMRLANDADFDHEGVRGCRLAERRA